MPTVLSCSGTARTRRCSLARSRLVAALTLCSLAGRRGNLRRRLLGQRSSYRAEDCHQEGTYSAPPAAQPSSQLTSLAPSLADQSRPIQGRSRHVCHPRSQVPPRATTPQCHRGESSLFALTRSLRLTTSPPASRRLLQQDQPQPRARVPRYRPGSCHQGQLARVPGCRHQELDAHDFKGIGVLPSQLGAASGELILSDDRNESADRGAMLNRI